MDYNFRDSDFYLVFSLNFQTLKYCFVTYYNRDELSKAYEQSFYE